MIRVQRHKLAVMAIDLHAVYCVVVIRVGPLNIGIGGSVDKLHFPRARFKEVKASNGFVTAMRANDAQRVAARFKSQDLCAISKGHLQILPIPRIAWTIGKHLLVIVIDALHKTRCHILVVSKSCAT